MLNDLNFAEDQPTTPPVRQKREERPERPKNNPKEDLGYRISGLEKARQEPGMSPADIAALDRAIAKLKEKKAEKEKPKSEEETV